MKHYRKWTEEVKQRCVASKIPYPPFAVINHYAELIGSNGIALAMRHAETDAAIANNTFRYRNPRSDLIPFDMEIFHNWLVDRRWNLDETTTIFLPMDEPVSFELLWEEYIQQLEKRKKILKVLKSDDVMNHLDEAKRLLTGPSAIEWGNAKGQARKALESLAMGITGNTFVKGLDNELQSRGLFGDTETKWIERFDDFLGATYSLGSKKGGHKPDPTRNEAEFYVAVASAVVDYVLSLLNEQ
ncbi:MAG: hypothetical protein E3J86_02880 [Candidatus Thorarchaeota archaeon]|nr:MAG: hypothetical protein E3J86_02880 [Candidatus Thorarchaeota archaeon]